MRRAIASAMVVLSVTACAGATRRAGPMKLQVPDDWKVTRVDDSSLQLADGQADDPRARGAATVVLDIWWESRVTRDSLAEQTGLVGEPIKVGRERGYKFEADDPKFAGRRTSVVVPGRRVLFVYRSAFAFDDSSFDSGSESFASLLSSVEFTGPPLALHQ